MTEGTTLGVYHRLPQVQRTWGTPCFGTERVTDARSVDVWSQS